MSNKLITMSDAEIERYLDDRFENYMATKVLDRPNFKPGSAPRDALYGPPVSIVMTRLSTQSIAAATHTVLVRDQISTLRGNIEGNTATGVITIKESGFYCVAAQTRATGTLAGDYLEFKVEFTAPGVAFPAAGTGTRLCENLGGLASTLGNAKSSLAMHPFIALDAGAQLRPVLYSNAGVTTFGAFAGYTFDWFAVQKVSDRGRLLHSDIGLFT